LIFQYLSSRFLKQLTDGAVTTVVGKLSQISVILQVKTFPFFFQKTFCFSILRVALELVLSDNSTETAVS